MDKVSTGDTFYSGSEPEGSGLLSEDDAGSSDPETSNASSTYRKKDGERKKTSRFSWFPSGERDNSGNSQGHQNLYRVYGWRWLMLVTLFLLNVNNGTVRELSTRWILKCAGWEQGVLMQESRFVRRSYCTSFLAKEMQPFLQRDASLLSLCEKN